MFHGTWNLGGVRLQTLAKGLEEAQRQVGHKLDVVSLQEIPRAEPAGHNSKTEGGPCTPIQRNAHGEAPASATEQRTGQSSEKSPTSEGYGFVFVAFLTSVIFGPEPRTSHKVLPKSCMPRKFILL